MALSYGPASPLQTILLLKLACGVQTHASDPVDLVLLRVEPFSEQAAATLQGAGWRVCYVDQVEAPSWMQTKKRFKGGHTKVFLDSDVSVLSSLDALLRHKAPAQFVLTAVPSLAASVGVHGSNKGHKVPARFVLAAVPSLTALQWLWNPTNHFQHFNLGVKILHPNRVFFHAFLAKIRDPSPVALHGDTGGVQGLWEGANPKP
ncbi:hypothetical protein T484DRAFT_1860851 [Baffinella frigidus]|nr:hypothetical protein T484DRAFT_1860851 [Cryptophyta sp. CCMP2293]